MLSQGISIQYGSPPSPWWETLLSAVVPALIGAGIALFVNWLANRHQTQLQRESIAATVAIARRTERRKKGEKLYELFDTWVRQIIEASMNVLSEVELNHPLFMTEIKASTLRTVIGDRDKYQRLVLLAHIDFPKTKELMNQVGREYERLYRLVDRAQELGRFSNEGIDELRETVKRLEDVADLLSPLIINEIASLYEEQRPVNTKEPRS